MTIDVKDKTEIVFDSRIKDFMFELRCVQSSELS